MQKGVESEISGSLAADPSRESHAVGCQWWWVSGSVGMRVWGSIVILFQTYLS